MVVEYTYDTCGTCSKKIKILIDDDIIIDVEFTRGCNGNLQGISKLVKGMNVSDVIRKLKGIDCEGKGTSCPDQLARALIEYNYEKRGNVS